MTRPSTSRCFRVSSYTGSALTTHIAWLFGAGFAPFVALAMSANWGLLSSGAYLLSGAACTLIALWINRRLATKPSVVPHAPE